MARHAIGERVTTATLVEQFSDKRVFFEAADMIRFRAGKQYVAAEVDRPPADYVVHLWRKHDPAIEVSVPIKAA